MFALLMIQGENSIPERSQTRNLTRLAVGRCGIFSSERVSRAKSSVFDDDKMRGENSIPEKGQAGGGGGGASTSLQFTVELY